MRRTVSASIDKLKIRMRISVALRAYSRANLTSPTALRQLAGLVAKRDITGMDAPNPSAVPGLATRAPMHIAAVGLGVRDLTRLVDFYREAIGLELLSDNGRRAVLGAGDTGFLHLEHAPDAIPDDPHSAGLYHTAFLMPTRGDLARWLEHAANRNIGLTGASDHSVSEALYLNDAEGNGIEVYGDRPAESWRWNHNQVDMLTKRLDLDDLLRDAVPANRSDTAPEGLRIGHVHLRVGDLAAAEKFWSDVIGLDITRRAQGALFMSSGSYHHHIACNVWQSQGAGKRDPGRAGLSWIALDATEAAFAALKARMRQIGAPIKPGADHVETADPWGTTVRVRGPS
jgi:catechol 2,3-dioxygenase